MRLDKFLKSCGILKRRTLAKELCDKGRVKVNGRQAKAGSEVKVGDILEIELGFRRIRGQVVDLPKSDVDRKLRGIYFAVSESLRLGVEDEGEGTE